ncbi:hypothetical protein MTR_3g115360 [Medicago truncatula]|uniref:Uncharacterized protein n=1 Tax=Medicago truncatula TaxID=3880 RepID=A0A072V3U2_MEDTR|nr:hypothetical protein MTR_3g115360 [Medicago truncatula]
MPTIESDRGWKIVTIFAWRLIRDRLSTRSNLAARGFAKARRSFIQLIWLLTTWVIWRTQMWWSNPLVCLGIG